MKKKHLFIIIGQSVAILLVVVYAFVQQTVAKEAERRAMAAQQEAEMQRNAAEAARKEAEVQRIMAHAARIECQNKSR
jgi:flagellar basal body-associated protein FliL